MHEIDHIIRAWKDDDYRLSLSPDEQRALPVNPAGSVELSGLTPEAAPDGCPYTVMFLTIHILTFC